MINSSHSLKPAILSNFRDWIRTIKRFPISQLHSKMIFNIREIFEIYREEKDPAKIDRFLKNSLEDVSTFKEIVQLPMNLIVQLYQPFSTTLANSNIVHSQSKDASVAE